MEIITSKEHCIITPVSPKLDSYETVRLKAEIESIHSKQIGLDLKYVKDCTIEFLDEIRKLGRVSLFNIPSDIFTLISVMNLDKSIKLYVSEIDFIENRRQILNRRLTVVG